MVRRCLCAVFLMWWGCVASSAEEVAERPVEPEIRVAFEDALKVLPASIREDVGDARLLRAPDLGIPVDSPLEYRLLNRAAFAAFSVGHRTLTIFDAGAAGKPQWGLPAPGADELVPFLAALADVLEVDAPKNGDDPSLGKAWMAFAERVYAWRSEKVPASAQTLGDPVVLDRFLEDGVWRSMGGKVPMVQMIVHEFGHALQLKGGTGSMGARMADWASLSGFTEVGNGKPTDGFAKGMNTTEHALVLIRLILTDDPARMPRGEEGFAERSRRFRGRRWALGCG